MPDKSRLLESALKVMEQMASDKKPYEMNVCGKSIIVLPGVFSPKYFTDSKFFASIVPNIVGKRTFLEIGTGTGIIALCVGFKNGSRVIANDINKTAVKNARINFIKHKLKISVRGGSVFELFHPNEKFDVIFWNHPFHNSPNKPANNILKSALDYHYSGLKAFFAGAKKHLLPNGEVLLGTSSIARINQIKKIAQKYGFIHKLLVKKKASFAHRRNMAVDLRVYSFVPRTH